MNEKLHEAEYFFCQMVASPGLLEHFRFNLSAFLSVARCVLEGVRIQAEARIGGYAWYERSLSKSRALAFFRHKGNGSISAQRVDIHADVAGPARDEIDIPLFEVVSGDVFDAGQSPARDESSSTRSPAVEASFVPGRIGTAYRLEGWPGPEDMYQLCALYLAELRGLVADGHRLGYVA